VSSGPLHPRLQIKRVLEKNLFCSHRFLTVRFCRYPHLPCGAAAHRTRACPHPHITLRSVDPKHPDMGHGWQSEHRRVYLPKNHSDSDMLCEACIRIRDFGGRYSNYLRCLQDNVRTFHLIEILTLSRGLALISFRTLLSSLQGMYMHVNDADRRNLCRSTPTTSSPSLSHPFW
jgi:hypothetical protein